MIFVFSVGSLHILGIPVSPFFDRDSTIICQAQFNFISFIVWPLYIELFNNFPSLSRLGKVMLSNQSVWLEESKEEPKCTKEMTDRMEISYNKSKKDFQVFCKYCEE